MAYVYNVNNVPGSGAGAILQLKNVLQQAGWTVTASSDGTTRYPVPNASPPNPDLFATNPGAMDSEWAWFVIKDPAQSGSSRQFLFQRSMNPYVRWRIKYSASAGFTGSNTDPARQLPIATDEIWLRGDANDSDYWGAFSYLFPDNMGNIRCHVVADNSAANGYSFWMCCYAIGGSAPLQGLMMDAMAAGTFPGGTTGDQDPVMMYFPVRDWNVFYARGLAGEDWGGGGWIKLGSSAQSFPVIPALTFCSTGGQIIPGNLGTNVYTNKDEGFPVLYARRGNLPYPSGYKGVSTLCRWLGVSRQTGDIEMQADGPRMVAGDVTLPWPNVQDLLPLI